MNAVQGILSASKRAAFSFINIQKRFRVKQKWASTKAKKSSSDYALEHCDLYYKPVFGSLWPSIRVALLSQKKHCAVINNFTVEQQKVFLELAELGASDLIHLAKTTSTRNRFSLTNRDSCNAIEERQLEHVDQPKVLGQNADENLESNEVNIDQLKPVPNTNVLEFMPVKKILSEKEQMRLQEIEQNIQSPENVAVQILPRQPIRFPNSLQAFAVGRGDLTLFPPAGRDVGGKLSYYLMDGGSILPVIALDLEPGCNVLDLCAAPGGKSYAILQTMLPEKLTCVDHSYNRIGRLKDVMKFFLPQSYSHERKIEIVHMNGITFGNSQLQQFDRVLVDVPCYADRHNVTEDENNIFRPIRLEERLNIQNIQQELLLAGIKSCKVGGIIVYSTCTLSLPQNDGTIQATLERIFTETEMDVAVEDTGNIADHFRKMMEFYGKCRYGQLVIPNLTANFGPTYFCKLRRLK